MVYESIGPFVAREYPLCEGAATGVACLLEEGDRGIVVSGDDAVYLMELEVLAGEVVESVEYLETNTLTTVLTVDDNAHSGPMVVGVEIEKVDASHRMVSAENILGALAGEFLAADGYFLSVSHQSQLTAGVDVGRAVFVNKLSQSLTRERLMRDAASPYRRVVLPLVDGFDIFRLHGP